MTELEESDESECNCDKCSGSIAFGNALQQSSPKRQKPQRLPTSYRPTLANKEKIRTNPKLPLTSKLPIDIEPSFLGWMEFCMSEILYNAMRKRKPNEKALEVLCDKLPEILTPYIAKAVSFYSHTSEILINSILDKMNSEIELVLKADPTLIDNIYCQHMSLLIDLTFRGAHKRSEYLRFCAVAIEIFIKCYAYHDFSAERAISLLAKVSCVIMKWKTREQVTTFGTWAKNFIV